MPYQTDTQERMTIVFTIDNAYAVPCEVTLRSLLASNEGTPPIIYILYRSLKAIYCKRLARIAAKYGSTITFLQIDDALLKNAPVNYHISLATYYRILIPTVLPATVSRVLFLDADILVRKDLGDLWRTDLAGYAFAASIAAGMDAHPAKIGLPAGGLYFNAGVMLMDLAQWRIAWLMDQCINLLQREPERIIWWDQDLLNIIFERSWLPIDLKWNAQPYLFDQINEAPAGLRQKYKDHGLDLAVTDPAIVHFAGGDKPWHRAASMAFVEEYCAYMRTDPRDLMRTVYQALKKSWKN